MQLKDGKFYISVQVFVYFIKIFRLYHEEWRTNEVLEDQGTDNEEELATFGFRGFKGDYEIRLMDGENELKSWTRNLDDNTPKWNLPMDDIS